MSLRELAWSYLELLGVTASHSHLRELTDARMMSLFQHNSALKRYILECNTTMSLY